LTGTGSRRFGSEWNVNLEAEFRQPLLQGNGVQFNRIAGPRSIPGFYNGVMIARISTDISLAEFEADVRDLVEQVERAYWTLYLRYQTLDAWREARDLALDTWRKCESLRAALPEADIARARHQYFDFRAQLQEAQSQLFSAENNLRYIIGLAAADGRLIRPADEPSAAKIDFDWPNSLSEALVRNVELRKQKWRIKQRELELIAAKNYLLPRLDAVGRYRWLGLGDDLIDPDGNPLTPPDDPNLTQQQNDAARFAAEFDNAYTNLTDGEFQEWYLGLELSIPIGFRKELAGVRHAELNVTKERAILQDMELELSHQLQEALRDLDRYYTQAQSNYNKDAAAESELERRKEDFERRGTNPERLASVLDQWLDAQRRVASAKIAYHQSLVLYNLALTQVHFRKGSLLEYDGVYLAEGPWPEKAYFDALRRGRARDASLYFDYGFTRPKVVSRGPIEQHAGAAAPIWDLAPVSEGKALQEEIPLPTPAPIDPVPSEEFPTPPAPQATRLPDQAESEAVGPRLTNASGVEMIGEHQMGHGGEKYDLGSLNLNVLTGNPAKTRAARNRQGSVIQPVAYEETTRPAGDPRPSEKGWTGKKTGAGRASVAKPSTPPADGNASGWRSARR
jgi:outer membrane protein TolC